jgi:hypothetical protein
VVAQDLPQPLPTDHHDTDRVPGQVSASLRTLQWVSGRPSFSGRVAVWMMNRSSSGLIRRGQPPAH